MIFDTFDNVKMYAASCPGLASAISFVRQFDQNSPDGKYEIDGENLFAMVQSYTTKSAGEVPFEAHRKYADVQILLAGRERIGVVHDSGLAVKQPYCDKGDCALFEAPAEYSTIAMKPDLFVLLFPQDAHQPGVKIAQPQDVRKVVVKIRI